MSARDPHAPWWTRPGVAAAVALVLAVTLGGGAWWQAWHASPNAVDAETLRAAAETAREIALVTPVVTAGADARVAWRAVPGATRYHVEVIDTAGAMLDALATPDTAATLPVALRPPAGTHYEWSVRARLADGTTRRSGTGRLVAP